MRYLEYVIYFIGCFTMGKWLFNQLFREWLIKKLDQKQADRVAQEQAKRAERWRDR